MDYPVAAFFYANIENKKRDNLKHKSEKVSNYFNSNINLNYSGEIASVGHTSAQDPQSVQSSGSIE